MAKIRSFDSFGAVFPHFCPDKCEICTRERTEGPLARAKFHVYRGNVSPLRGEKPLFRLLSKNNTGMAALRAGLPVIKECGQDIVLLKLHRGTKHRADSARAELSPDHSARPDSTQLNSTG